MKRIHPNTACSFLFAFVSGGLTFYQYKFTPSYFDFRIASGAIAVIGWFAASSEIKKYTSNFQFAGMFLGGAALGISIDPFLHAFPFETCAMLLLTAVMNWRILFRRWISETSYWGIDALLWAMPVALYVAGNVVNRSGWPGWAYPLPLIGLASFILYSNISHGKMTLDFVKNGFAIEVGKPAPDFTLPGDTGNTVRLSSYQSQKDVLLIFVRGDWCPSCHIMLRTYDRHAHKFQEKDIAMFAIGPDPVGANRAMVEKLGVEVNILSDEGQKVSMAYGVHMPSDVVGEQYKPGIPLPAAFLIDKRGIIRYTTRPDRIGEFLAPETIFPILETLN